MDYEYPKKVELTLDLKGNILEKKVAEEIREEDIPLFIQGAYRVEIDGIAYYKMEGLDKVIKNGLDIKRKIVYASVKGIRKSSRSPMRGF